jgi:hypothetical protein
MPTEKLLSVCTVSSEKVSSSMILMSRSGWLVRSAPARVARMPPGKPLWRK